MYTTTVQKFIVVVSAATAVATTVQKFIVVVMPVTHVPTTLANIYREGGREGGITFRCFKLAENWTCIS